MAAPRSEAELTRLARPIHVADIGAAYINYEPPYKTLLQLGLGRLSAFEADENQLPKLREVYGNTVDLYHLAIADGEVHTLYICPPNSGMTSILKPSKPHLDYLTHFSLLGTVLSESKVETTRLDDIAELAPIDFLKMDIQGAELMALAHATTKIAGCVAIQTEVSFLALYENHPTFGEVDRWMAAHGFVPHTSPELVRWAFAPYTVDHVVPKQLLYADIVYIRDPTRMQELDDEQLKRLYQLAIHVFGTLDLAAFVLRHLRQREAAGA